MCRYGRKCLHHKIGYKNYSFSAVVKFNIALIFKRLKTKNYKLHHAMSHKPLVYIDL